MNVTDQNIPEELKAEPIVVVKRCALCSLQKPLIEFSGRTLQTRRRKSYCKSCSTVKQREWYRARQTGCEPTRLHYDTPRPQCTPTTEEVAWAAGFLEGEGSFQRRAGMSLRVQATQATTEPLLRLQKLFGGRIRKEARRHPSVLSKKTIFRWTAYGILAEQVMQSVHPWLSARRKEQIDKCL